MGDRKEEFLPSRPGPASRALYGAHVSGEFPPPRDFVSCVSRQLAQHLALAQAQLERSSRNIDESVELQRVAVARQAQVRNVALPLIVALLALLGYLLVKWRVLQA